MYLPISEGKWVKVEFRGPNLPTNPLTASHKVNQGAIFKSANEKVISIWII